MDKVDLNAFGDSDKDAEPAGPIRDFEIDTYNLEEMAGHAVTEPEVRAILHNRYALLRNARRHTDQPYIMVGRTDGGRWLAVPIGRSKRDPSKWRPATAYDAPEPDIIKARRTIGGST
jgi:hypothetical protein